LETTVPGDDYDLADSSDGKEGGWNRPDALDQMVLSATSTSTVIEDFLSTCSNEDNNSAGDARQAEAPVEADAVQSETGAVALAQATLERSRNPYSAAPEGSLRLYWVLLGFTGLRDRLSFTEFDRCSMN